MGAVWQHGPPPSRGIRVGRGCDGLGLYERAIELRDGRRALTLALSQGERG